MSDGWLPLLLTLGVVALLAAGVPALTRRRRRVASHLRSLRPHGPAAVRFEAVYVSQPEYGDSVESRRALVLTVGGEAPPHAPSRGKVRVRRGEAPDGPADPAGTTVWLWAAPRSTEAVEVPVCWAVDRDGERREGRVGLRAIPETVATTYAYLPALDVLVVGYVVVAGARLAALHLGDGRLVQDHPVPFDAPAPPFAGDPAAPG